jgi:hypothetical protein
MGERLKVIGRSRRRGAYVGSVPVLLVLMAACGTGGDEGSDGDHAGAVTAAADHTSAAEASDDGWRPLFDGETLDGWRGYRLDGLPAGWEVERRMIHFVPPAEGQRADLMTIEQFANFELELQWAVSEGGNSGIMFRVSEDHDRSYETGAEYQILDNERHPDGEKPETSAGSNYALHAPAVDATRPVGEFNEARLRVDGDQVTHWLNGQELLQYTLWDDDWKARVAASKFAAMPGYGLNKSGHIVLQDHGNELWFRDIRIKPLP